MCETSSDQELRYCWKLLKCNLTRSARVLKKTLRRWVGWWGSTVDTHTHTAGWIPNLSCLAKLPWSSPPGPVTWNMKSLFKRDRESGGCKKSLIGKLFNYCPHLPMPPRKARLHLSSSDRNWLLPQLPTLGSLAIWNYFKGAGHTTQKDFIWCLHMLWQSCGYHTQ